MKTNTSKSNTRRSYKRPIVKKNKVKTPVKNGVIPCELQAEDQKRRESKQRVEKKLKEFINPLLVQRQEDSRKERSLLGKIIHKPGYGAIKISNIRHTTIEQELGTALEERGSGKIRLLNLCNSNKEDFSRNHSYVFFRRPGAAQRMAAELNNSIFLNKVVKVSYIEPQNLKPDQFRKTLPKTKASKSTT